MDFGRLPDISKVDFSLPPDHPDTKVVLETKKAEHCNIYVGCPIWTEKSWLGKIYPLKTAEKDYLHYYAKKFNTIELNTTHYRIPDDTTLDRWVRSASQGFKFSPKIPQLISHAPDITQMTDLMHEFIHQMQQLKEYLGTSFMQLHPTFGPKRLPELLNFLDHIPFSFKMAIELRNPDWFNNSIETEDLFQYMKEKQISTVITDVAGRRDVLHQRLTTSTAMVRFVANNLHPTDFTRLDAWAERLKKWQAEDLENFYFFIHTPDKGNCLPLADEFNRRIGIFPDINTPAISNSKTGYIQGSLF